MSQENVEVARQALDAYSRRDVDGLRALAWPDMELDWSASRGFQAEVYRGFESALSFYRQYFEAFQEIVFDPASYIDAGDSVVVPNVARQRGRDGIEVVARSALVFTVRGGRITRIRLYQHTQEALDAVGLGVGDLDTMAGRRANQPSINEEIVRQVYLEKGPLTDALQLAPDAEFDFTDIYPDRPVLRGVEAMRGFRDGGPWGRSIHFEPERYFDVDEQRVLVFVRVTSTGQTSGAGVESLVAQEFTLRDGLIVRVKVHRDRAEAVKALGLEE